VVTDLIEQKFGIRFGFTAFGALLAKLNLTPQKPLQRAYQRDPVAIERWQRETYAGRVPPGADLVCYWFEKARAMAAGGEVRRGRQRQHHDRSMSSC